MEQVETDLQAAEDAVRRLADGPAMEAAQALEQAFSEAGRSIEASLQRAARSGELDFSRMAQSVLSDLARIAAETALAGLRTREAVPAMTFNLTGQGGDAAPSAKLSRAELGKAVAKAAALGRRFG